jgi:hypothetical protein
MKKILLLIFMTFNLMLLGFSVEKAYANHVPPRAATAGECESSFFGLPSWHKYVEKRIIHSPLTDTELCEVDLDGIGDVWFVAAAAIEILLRIAALISIGFIVYGGVLYVISQGAPDKTKQAEQTVINAIVGLAVAIAATAIVSFVAGRFN